ncbi:KH domain-containing protein [Stenomitos frigidus]|uniref:KH domain-containing protein n=1 Tax=Stenomitos frigidus ULC18 TaxID=2107698 RepID=A0A2T1DZZ3_9CYAN|nr:KH domain-containing protein [Stenomitos frigidus]PSB26011.1 KH domain-containing protein [Stenomitos frigidus ULC18]
MPETNAKSATSEATEPDYARLVTFLVEPFLELPESLKVDCEVSPSRGKVWVRVAFEGADKGRVFGRGGRNIQAIRSVLEAAARAAGYSAYLDVFGSSAQGGNDGEIDREDVIDKPPPRRSSGVKEPPKLRSRSSPPEV